MNLFSSMKEPFKFKHRPIRLFEAFSGIGTQAMALKRMGIEIEHVGISEIDKHAINSYNAIHGNVKNYGSIVDIKGKDLPQIDLFTWSFPCTDLSKAGKQKGLNNTRSGLGYEVIRIISEMENKPKVLLMENVPDLLSAKFRDGWHEMYNEIERLGYTNYVETLNAKNYGVAQNRERVFMVSILGDYAYEFPQPFKLEKRLKDYLEDEVDEKYYLSDKQLKQISNWNAQRKPLDDAKTMSDDMIQTITAKSNTSMNSSMLLIKEPLKIKTWNDETKAFKTRDDDMPRHRIYDTESVGFAITTNESQQPTILIPEATKQGYAKAQNGDGVYLNRPHQKRGVVQKGLIQKLKTSGSDVGVVVKDTRNLKERLADDLLESGTVKGGEIINHSYTNKSKNPNSRLTLEDYIETTDGIMPTLTTRPDTLGVVTNPTLRIRKLTPLEAWRLMGIDDQDFYKAQTVCSNMQLYKQAGNAIVVDVLVEIFSKLF